MSFTYLLILERIVKVVPIGYLIILMTGLHQLYAIRLKVVKVWAIVHSRRHNLFNTLLGGEEGAKDSTLLISLTILMNPYQFCTPIGVAYLVKNVHAFLYP